MLCDGRREERKREKGEVRKGKEWGEEGGRRNVKKVGEEGGTGEEGAELDHSNF